MMHELKSQRSDLTLRVIYARALLLAMIAQVALADWFFWKYMLAFEFRAPEKTMIAWLAGGVVEIIGLVFVITRYLFPDNND